MDRAMLGRDRLGRYEGLEEVNRSVRMQVRLTPTEWEIIKRHAHDHGVCISVYVRRKLLDLLRL